MAQILNEAPIYSDFGQRLILDGFNDRFKNDHEYKDDYYNKNLSQVVTLHLNASYTLGAMKYASGRTGKVIHLSFDSTQIRPGNLAWNLNRVKGAFLDKCVLKVWFQKDGTSIDQINPNHAIDDVRLLVETPEGAPNESGSISSSISYNINASAGVFGDAPMATEGGGLSVGESFSHQMHDFTFESHSSSKMLEHWYPMTQDAEGHPYHKAYDLLKQKGTLCRIRELPTLSRSNFPLVSQCVFGIKPTSPYMNSKLLLCIDLYAHFSCVYTKCKGFEQVGNAFSFSPHKTFRHTIDFSSIQP